MFGKKKNIEKKNIETRYNLDQLYVAYIGIKGLKIQQPRETIICRCEKELSHSVYTDVLTGKVYYLYSDYKSDDGEAVVGQSQSLLSVFKNGEYKNNLLRNGYVTKEQLIDIYNALNNKTGYIESKEDKKKQQIADSCSDLTKKEFINEPTILREEELEKLMISLALNKKIALIVGEKGTGKTALIEELAYLIQRGTVPNFLKNKTILEINIPSLRRKEQEKDSIENRIKTVIDAAKETNAILFIDDANDIITNQEGKEENKNIIQMLKYYAEREGIKIIVTTNNIRYKEYIEDDNFKRKFDVIKVQEPKEEELKQIILRKINEQSINNQISTNEITEQLPEIITLLVATTQPSNALFTSNEKNPGLVLSVIDRSFAIAKAKKQNNLTINNIQAALKDNNQIEPGKNKKAIELLEGLKVNSTVKTPKQLKKV